LHGPAEILAFEDEPASLVSWRVKQRPRQVTHDRIEIGTQDSYKMTCADPMSTPCGNYFRRLNV
jgi:hypothetical protein